MDKETIQHENRLVSNEWKEFAKTTAFRKLMEYIEFQDYIAVQAAKGPILTFDNEDGSQVDFDASKAAYLLQRSVGYDIMKSYIEGYVNYTTSL